MTTPREQYEPYYTKAAQSWLGAQSELAAGRFDNAIALAYYPCFQLAVAAMTLDGVPPDRREGYSHRFSWDEIDRNMDLVGAPGEAKAIRTVYAERLNAQYRPDGHTLEETQAIMAKAAGIIEALRRRLDQFLDTSGVWETPDDDSDQNA